MRVDEVDRVDKVYKVDEVDRVDKVYKVDEVYKVDKRGVAAAGFTLLPVADNDKKSVTPPFYKPYKPHQPYQPFKKMR